MHCTLLHIESKGVSASDGGLLSFILTLWITYVYFTLCQGRLPYSRIITTWEVQHSLKWIGPQSHSQSTASVQSSNLNSTLTYNRANSKTTATQRSPIASPMATSRIGFYLSYYKFGIHWVTVLLRMVWIRLCIQPFMTNGANSIHVDGESVNSGPYPR